MFLGTHQPRLDEKGRLFMPAKFRDELAGGLVITKGQERCLYVFPAAEFAAMTNRMSAAPVTRPGPKVFHRGGFAELTAGLAVIGSAGHSMRLPSDGVNGLVNESQLLDYPGRQYERIADSETQPAVEVVQHVRQRRPVFDHAIKIARAR